MSTLMNQAKLTRVSPEWRDWFAGQRRSIDAAISSHLNELKTRPVPHCRLTDAVEYSLREGGKRLRPIVVLETCRVCGGSQAAALPAAIAVECVHAFSLIHDDLPAMDDGDLRRGRPTNHKVFGEALAILAGDWLMTHAFALLASERVGKNLSPALIEALAAGTLGMIAGQAADIESEGLAAGAEKVEFIHLHKTARLLEACCRMGALCAGASVDEVQTLADFGRRLGLAFQIVDDLLDHDGSEAAVGKRLGKDAVVSKQTFPAALGLQESRLRARQEIEAAVAALKSFGPRADRLRGLAHFVIAREH